MCDDFILEFSLYDFDMLWLTLKVLIWVIWVRNLNFWKHKLQIHLENIIDGYSNMNKIKIYHQTHASGLIRPAIYTERTLNVYIIAKKYLSQIYENSDYVKMNEIYSKWQSKELIRVKELNKIEDKIHPYIYIYI